jgi:streptomycin 6-kinase
MRWPRRRVCCASAVEQLLPEAGERLLHWDLHFDNVLAGLRDQGSWLAIDPKPLAGDPGFELLAALHNRWGDVTADANPARAILRRFDLMTGALSLDRQRARGWTLGRILQNLLWELDGADVSAHTDRDRLIARTLLDRRPA